MDDYKSLTRKRVTGMFTGIEFEIRKVRMLDCIRSLGTLPNLVNLSVQEQLKRFEDHLKAKEHDPEWEEKSVRMLLERGIVSPKIWFDNESECPDDAICLADLGSDADYLAGEISIWSFQLAGLQKLDSFFRGSGAWAPGPGSEEIRAEAVEANRGNGVEHSGAA